MFLLGSKWVRTMTCTDFNCYELKEKNDPVSDKGKLYGRDESWMETWVREQIV